MWVVSVTTSWWRWQPIAIRRPHWVCLFQCPLLIAPLLKVSQVVSSTYRWKYIFVNNINVLVLHVLSMSIEQKILFHLIFQLWLSCLHWKAYVGEFKLSTRTWNGFEFEPTQATIKSLKELELNNCISVINALQLHWRSPQLNVFRSFLMADEYF